MLTDISKRIESGRIDPDIHLSCTAKLELIDFITEELPQWRDHPDRPPEEAESILTEQLCSHLNSAAYYSTAWSHIQFQTETTDETYRGRKIDLAPKPLGRVILIEGRRHTQFDSLFPIECKRLPTPKEKDRDEREYVISGSGTTGGIQRFKLGYHGAVHSFAAMIAYVQDESFSHWIIQVNTWIKNLAIKSDSIWTDADILEQLCNEQTKGISKLISRHTRPGELDEFELRHIWINMS